MRSWHEICVKRQSESSFSGVPPDIRRTTAIKLSVGWFSAISGQFQLPLGPIPRIISIFLQEGCARNPAHQLGCSLHFACVWKLSRHCTPRYTQERRAKNENFSSAATRLLDAVPADIKKTTVCALPQNRRAKRKKSWALPFEDGGNRGKELYCRFILRYGARCFLRNLVKGSHPETQLIESTVYAFWESLMRFERNHRELSRHARHKLLSTRADIRQTLGWLMCYQIWNFRLGIVLMLVHLLLQLKHPVVCWVDTNFHKISIA